MEVIKHLQIDEGGNLQKVYMASHYQNYNKLKKIMGIDESGKFVPMMLNFLEILRAFNSQVRNTNKDNVERLINEYNDDKYESFLEKLRRLTRFESQRKLSYEELKNMSNEDFIRTYVEYYIRQGKLPNIAVTFRRYSKTLQNEFREIFRSFRS